jgi:hypothetical protein
MNIIKSCLFCALACSMICAYAQPTKREQVRDDAIQEQLDRDQQKKEAQGQSGLAEKKQQAKRQEAATGNEKKQQALQQWWLASQKNEG